MIASGRSNRAFRSKWTCSGSRSPALLPGAQWWWRNHTEIMVGGATSPPVSSSATASSQNSGLPFSTDAQLVQM